MSKNVLFLVTGKTTQVITETVWALACDPNNQEQWVPDEVHVLSTQDGLDQIRLRLFQNNIFSQFKDEYPQLKHILFDETCLTVFRNDEGEPLVDLKTPEENEYAANMICQKIRTFTGDDDITLHVSIAGGRKTMGFYAGYALSLYGRAQDRMSHVLVEDKFEKASNFFYPSVNENDFAEDYAKQFIGRTKDAKIWLANIPFVRMKDAIKDKHQLKQDSFTQVVQKINESFNDVKLIIDLPNRTVQVNDKFIINDLPPREFAMLSWFAVRKKENKEGIIAPKDNMTSSKISQQELKKISALTADYLQYYAELKNDPDISVDKKFFEGVKSLLKSSLETAFGLELAAKIAIVQENRGKPFYLNLNPDCIEIIDKFKSE